MNTGSLAVLMCSVNPPPANPIPVRVLWQPHDREAVGVVEAAADFGDATPRQVEQQLAELVLLVEHERAMLAALGRRGEWRATRRKTRTR